MIFLSITNSVNSYLHFSSVRRVFFEFANCKSKGAQSWNINHNLANHDINPLTVRKDCAPYGRLRGLFVPETLSKK